MFGADRGVETVYLRGSSGRSVLGRWYDKSIEANLGPRGSIIRGEDQRRWAKPERRGVSELTAAEMRRSFKRRFVPLWKATKGVTVAGPMVMVDRVLEAVDAGEILPQRARLLVADTMLEACGRDRDLLRPSTLRASRRYRRDLGLVLADGVLQEVEVEVDVGAVLEQALETDAWERRG